MSSTNPSNELKITRVYDAPVKAVWEAWTDPAKVAQWWGPRGFTLTTHSKDLRPGGVWSYTMHGPDGVDYPNTTLYHEVEPLAKLVYDHGGSAERPPLFRVTALFSNLGAKTRLDLTFVLPTPEAAEQTRQFIKKAGGESTWDRLAEYLAERDGNDIFVINRSFDVPRERMFEAWINPDQRSIWMAPVGFQMQLIRSENWPGGSTFYKMIGDKGPPMYGRSSYLQIDRPQRVVYHQQFCDEHENVIRHPMSATWPLTMLTTLELTEEGPARTRLTLTWTPSGTVTPTESETFRNARSGMTQGWTGSLDKLETYLAK